MRDNRNERNNSRNTNQRVVRGSSRPTNNYNQRYSNQYYDKQSRQSNRPRQNSRYDDSYNYSNTRTVVKRRKKLNKKGKFVISLFVLMLTAIVAYFVLFNMQLFNGEVGQLFKGIGTPDDLKGKQVNFLVLGIADDPNEREQTRLTDLMAIVSVDFENEEVNVLQIPRDTFIGDETPSGKMNAIYNRDPDYWDYHGLEGLSKMINEMFKLTIDHYITMDMEGFRDIVDAVGGVTMNVPADVELNGTYVYAGEQTLNGEQAIAVVRTRNIYSNQDIGRMETQREFMKAFVSKILSLGKIDMAKLAPTCIKYVNTDVTLNQGLKYYKAISGLNMQNFNIFSPEGTPDVYDSYSLGEQDVYVLDKESTATMLNENFRNHTEPVSAEMLQIKSLEDY